jgi:hypothetical protein
MVRKKRHGPRLIAHDTWARISGGKQTSLKMIKFDQVVKSQVPTANYKSSPIVENWQGAQILSKDSR